MTLGNLVALTQDNVKRMLAYSSIAHTGYMLVGLAAWAGDPTADRTGLEALLFYGVAYAFMNLGAFAVIAALQKRTGRDLAASTRSPASAGGSRCSAILMTLFLLSLTGIPPTAGFFAKANVILAAVQAGGPLTILAVITVLNAAVAAFYYLRVVVYMFMRDPASDAPAAPPRRAAVGRAGGGHGPARSCWGSSPSRSCRSCGAAAAASHLEDRARRRLAPSRSSRRAIAASIRPTSLAEAATRSARSRISGGVLDPAVDRHDDARLQPPVVARGDHRIEGVRVAQVVAERRRPRPARVAAMSRSAASPLPPASRGRMSTTLPAAVVAARPWSPRPVACLDGLDRARGPRRARAGMSSAWRTWNATDGPLRSTNSHGGATERRRRRRRPAPRRAARSARTPPPA